MARRLLHVQVLGLDVRFALNSLEVRFALNSLDVRLLSTNQRCRRVKRQVKSDVPAGTHS